MSCTGIGRFQNQRTNSTYYQPIKWYVPINKERGNARTDYAQKNMGQSGKNGIYAPTSTSKGVLENGLEQPTEQRTGVASWYGPGFHGKATSNGETYNQYAMTAAHRFLPLNSLVRVTNMDNGRQVVVRINDRGPYAKDRILDGSYALAQKLDYLKQGTANVRLDVMQYPNNFDPKFGLAAYKQTVVQLGAFNDMNSASNFKKKIEQNYGSLPFIIDKPKGQKYFVLIGPYNQRGQANQIGSSLKRDGHRNIVRSFRK